MKKYIVSLLTLGALGCGVGTARVPARTALDVTGSPRSGLIVTPTSVTERRAFDHARKLFRTESAEGVRSAEARQALEDFVDNYPASPLWPEAMLMLGDCYFFEHDYSEALLRYGSVDLGKLPMTERERDLYAYRLCVTRLRNGIADAETKRLLNAFADKPGFRLAGEYYRAYDAYLNRDYDKAWRGFEKVAEELADGVPAPEGMAPNYYRMQILYRNGKFGDVIKYGSVMMVREPVAELLPELHRIVGLSYFKTGDLLSAHGLLERYVDNATANGYEPAADAVYALGICDYEAGEPERAARRFSTLTDLHDMLGQGSWYHLGEIAMANGDYDEAVMDFDKARRLAYDPETAERAAYNGIAAVTRGGKSPFANVSAMYEEFLTEWPESRYGDDVRRGLYQAYAAQNDYDHALEILNAIKRPDERVRLEKQKLLYTKGTRQERAGRHKEAAATLRQAVAEGADPALTAEAGLWLGDALYGAGDYAASVKAFDKALAAKKQLTGDRRATALYQRGYANMRSEKYRDAVRDFSEVLKSGKATRELTNDARLRLADCQYYTGNLAGATEIYKEVRETDKDAGDYATLRLALLAGLQGDRVSETAMLRDFLRNSPDSPARAEAMSKLGASLEARGLARDAVSVYDDLLKEFPTSPYAREGALKSAKLTMADGSADEAEAKFRNVIALYPKSDEATEADRILRDYHARIGDLEQYAAWLTTVKDGPRIGESEVEEIKFKAAERAYVADQNDVAGLKDYVDTYPHGEYVSSALLWIANSAFDNGRSREALTAVERILSDYPDSAEAEDARLLKEDLREYAELFDALTQADSRNESKKGLDALKRIARNPDSAVGAQANVELAERLLKAGRTAEARELMEDFTSSGTGQQYWVARGFLVLADAHHADGKDHLAREYVTALRDNYPGDEQDIRSGIERRLSQYGNATKSQATGGTRKSRKRK